MFMQPTTYRLIVQGWGTSKDSEEWVWWMGIPCLRSRRVHGRFVRLGSHQGADFGDVSLRKIWRSGNVTNGDSYKRWVICSRLLVDYYGILVDYPGCFVGSLDCTLASHWCISLGVKTLVSTAVVIADPMGGSGGFDTGTSPPVRFSQGFICGFFFANASSRPI